MQVDALALALPTIDHPLAPMNARVVVHLSMHESFRALGLTTPEAFLAIPGEIVSGHPDRHVMRVVLGNGRVAYLKREHRIRWKDRFRNWRANFGWSSKSIREGRILQQLEERGLPGPRWLAFGEDGNGRAFVLIEEAVGAVDLRHALPDLSDPDGLAIHLGRLCAELHEAGVDHPDLWSKHFLINPGTHAITLIDWPRATLGRPVSWARRFHALAALRATVADSRSRLAARFLWAYLRVVRVYRNPGLPKFSSLVLAIDRHAARLLRRRGVREQRQPPLDDTAQRLIWLDGEALCAIPEAAAALASPVIGEMLYDPIWHAKHFSLNELTAKLEVGHYRALLSRCWSWIRGRAWRSPELRKARLLFHLERHHIPAPKLLAYGQRCLGLRAKAFLLAEAIDALPFPVAYKETDEDGRHLLLEQLSEVLSRLHEAGCEARTIDCFSVRDEGSHLTIVISDPERLVFRKHLSPRRERMDRARVLGSMNSHCEFAACGVDLNAMLQAAMGGNR